ncbi:acetyl-CoA carboxylase biotin carboxylase subunit family protein [Streptomyces sp. NPDC021093]|uniref:acetyl-CoA carboxylase biotin carboxylase subunit family protein n=1 Tax=Streptomyces sp. NPDC021093 TaxID=3365112 RepID=UPI00378D2B70
MSSDCFVVTGYNNTRIYDIAKLREICRQEYGAKVVLVTEQAKPEDHEAADVVLVSRLGEVGSADAAEPIAAELRRLGLKPVGILPFSDRGVPMGACLASYFALPGADPAQALIGLDKRRFRRLEAGAAAHPAGYEPLRSLPVGTLDEFEAAVERLGGTAFVKPVGEGNSRGCQAVSGVSMCRSVWETLEPYHRTGVMVESLVRDAHEYSWDFVGGFRWLTEKRTTTRSRFRAEVQQIVPAPLEPAEDDALDRAGEHVRQLVSTSSGAFHNELFLRADGVSAVETNMRPGGMHIWDLAQLSFEDFDPWRTWLRWAVSGETRHIKLKPRAYSGIRMLAAPSDGILISLPDISKLAQELEIPVHRAVFTKSVSDRVSADVMDNSGFIGHIILVADHSKTLVDRLDELAHAVEAQTVVHPR